MYQLGVRTIAPEKNCPPVGVRVWFIVRVRVRVGGNCPRTINCDGLQTAKRK